MTDVLGIEIPNELVDQFYEMNPETEDLLFDGNLLKPGMIVLIELPQMRMPLAFEDGKDLEPELMDVARITNRWCELEHVAIVKGPRISLDVVSFIGKFGDGVKRKRSTPIEFAWIVKRNSIPQE